MRWLFIILIVITCLSCSKNYGTCDCSGELLTPTKHTYDSGERQHQPGESCEELGERLTAETTGGTYSCEEQ
jgi:hypothetical protein